MPETGILYESRKMNPREAGIRRIPDLATHHNIVHGVELYSNVFLNWEQMNPRTFFKFYLRGDLGVPDILELPFTVLTTIHHL